LRQLALSMATMLLAGCVGLTQDPPERHWYALDAPRQGPSRPRTDIAILKVSRFRSSPPSGEQALLIQVGPHEFRSDYYNGFAAPPAELITGALERWLRTSGLVGAVVNPSSRMEPTHLLEGSLVSLYGDATAESGCQAVVELELALIDAHASPAQLTLSRSYRRAVRVSQPRPDPWVGGWNSALAEIFAEFEEDVARIGIGVH
jgi:cholesterol transport system auxiliary component